MVHYPSVLGLHNIHSLEHEHIIHGSNAYYCLRRSRDRGERLWSRKYNVILIGHIQVLFSLYHYYLIHSISKPGDSHDPAELPEMQVAFHRVLQSGLLQDVIPADEIKAVPTVKKKWTYHQADAFEQLKPDDPRAIDFRNALRPWFRNVPWSTIGQQDLRRWLYWAVFNAVLPDNQDDLSHAHKTAMEDVMELIRRRTGTDVQPGSNPICQPLMLTLDPVNVWSRPLLWYMFVAVVNGIAWKHIQSKWDVRHGKFQGLEYAPCLRISS
jgi:hypothetical protein